MYWIVSISKAEKKYQTLVLPHENVFAHAKSLYDRGHHIANVIHGHTGANLTRQILHEIWGE
jgi:hypothetical protein